MGKQSESIGVAFKVGDVIPESFRNLAFQEAAAVLREERLDSFLSRVSERWVSHVMSKTGCLHDGAYLLEKRIAQLRVLVCQPAGHIITETLTQRGYLERVSEAVVYEDAAREWEHLRLVLKAAKGCRIDQPVAVALKLRAVIMTQSVPVLLSKTFITDKLLPVHDSILLRFSQSYAYFVAFRLFNRNYLNYLFEIA